MEAWLVYVTFTDGQIEGVIFTNYDDAIDAYAGVDGGSSLAVSWGEIYGDAELLMEIKEIII